PRRRRRRRGHAANQSGARNREAAGGEACSGTTRYVSAWLTACEGKAWQGMRHLSAHVRVAQRVSYVTQNAAREINDLRVAHVCRAVAGLPPPSPTDDRRDRVRREQMV